MLRSRPRRRRRPRIASALRRRNPPTPRRGLARVACGGPAASVGAGARPCDGLGGASRRGCYPPFLARGAREARRPGGCGGARRSAAGSRRPAPAPPEAGGWMGLPSFPRPRARRSGTRPPARRVRKPHKEGPRGRFLPSRILGRRRAGWTCLWMGASHPSQSALLRRLTRRRRPGTAERCSGAGALRRLRTGRCPVRSGPPPLGGESGRGWRAWVMSCCACARPLDCKSRVAPAPAVPFYGSVVDPARFALLPGPPHATMVCSKISAGADAALAPGGGW